MQYTYADIDCCKNFLKYVLEMGRFCGLVARVHATDPEVPGSIPSAPRFSE
jgi:hypothetical protein